MLKSKPLNFPLITVVCVCLLISPSFWKDGIVVWWSVHSQALPWCESVRHSSERGFCLPPQSISLAFLCQYLPMPPYVSSLWVSSCISAELPNMPHTLVDMVHSLLAVLDNVLVRFKHCFMLSKVSFVHKTNGQVYIWQSSDKSILLVRPANMLYINKPNNMVCLLTEFQRS